MPDLQHAKRSVRLDFEADTIVHTVVVVSSRWATGPHVLTAYIYPASLSGEA
jgi:hypothetical protein